MKKVILLSSFALLIACKEKSTSSEKTAAFDPTPVQKAMETVHKAFNERDTASMFAYFSNDSKFFGTDVAENWDVEGFKEYMREYVAKSKSKEPIYKVVGREITPSADGKTAWVVETLDYPKLPIDVRGTAVLEKTKSGWKLKLQQWHFLIDNDDVNDVCTVIEMKQDQ